MAEGVNVAVLEQRLDDHLADCISTREMIYSRLGKIEGLLSRATLALISTLFALVLLLAGEVYHLATGRVVNAVTIAAPQAPVNVSTPPR
ncbi:MAG TPA: hypothetical protein VMU59_09230 [Caulobacteraceae bacterium]|nr:hypothetical protein [Caulobacteraceae bacterium]